MHPQPGQIIRLTSSFEDEFFHKIFSLEKGETFTVGSVDSDGNIICRETVQAKGNIGHIVIPHDYYEIVFPDSPFEGAQPGDTIQMLQDHTIQVHDSMIHLRDGQTFLVSTRTEHGTVETVEAIILGDSIYSYEIPDGVYKIIESAMKQTPGSSVVEPLKITPKEPTELLHPDGIRELSSISASRLPYMDDFVSKVNESIVKAASRGQYQATLDFLLSPEMVLLNPETNPSHFDISLCSRSQCYDRDQLRIRFRHIIRLLEARGYDVQSNSDFTGMEPKDWRTNVTIYW